MVPTRTIDVDHVVDSQRLSRLNYSLMIWSFLLLLLDGFDIHAAAVTAPQFIKEWNVAPASIGPMLSAANFGVLFGAPLFGWVGDRFGRKPAILTSATVFGLFTLATVWATSIHEVAVLRMCAGIGIAGVLTNAIAINAEMAPARMRATIVITIFLGNTLGGAVPGLIAPWLLQHYGWQGMFYIGGVLPLLMVPVLYVVLPESIKFLSLSPARQPEALALARRMQTGLAIGAHDRIAGLVQPEEFKGTFGDLFRGRFALITPLIWLLFAVNLMVFYFSSFWMPTVVGPAIVKAGGSANEAGVALALYQVGGSIGGVLLSRFIDRWGVRPLIVYVVLAIPAIVAIGQAATTASPWLLPIAFMAGFGVLGAQFGLNAAAGMIYPTHIRSKGVGWAFGIGRFGAVIGPMIGGLLLAAHVGVEDMYALAATPYLVTLVALVVLVRITGETRPPAAAAAAAIAH